MELALIRRLLLGFLATTTISLDTMRNVKITTFHLSLYHEYSKNGVWCCWITRCFLVSWFRLLDVQYRNSSSSESIWPDSKQIIRRNIKAIFTAGFEKLRILEWINVHLVLEKLHLITHKVRNYSIGQSTPLMVTIHL